MLLLLRKRTISPKKRRLNERETTEWKIRMEGEQTIAAATIPPFARNQRVPFKMFYNKTHFRVRDREMEIAQYTKIFNGL